jgi:hypothetical protein
MAATQWKTYEEVATYLLNQFAEHFGVGRFEGKQLVPGESGTQWEIDAKGFKEGHNHFIVVECKRYLDRGISQETAAALAWRIEDTGATGGIIVSPLGLQEGARLVAMKAGICEVKLSPDSTTTDYVLKFLNHLCVGVSDRVTFSDRVTITITDKNGNVVGEG